MATGYVPARASQSEVPASAASAVDDLVKFRLIEAMLGQPGRPATAGELATRLGFHSVELTGVALDELTGDGLLSASRRDGELGYLLRPDEPLRAELVALIAAGPPGLFNRLAAASVLRIKRLLRARD